MKRGFRLGLIAAAMLLVVDAHGQHPADDSPVLEEAQARFRRGLELYAENDFRAALVELQRAYALAPSYRILYNVAQVQFQLQDYAGALRSFQTYLEEGGDRIDRSRRKEVEQDIDTLRARVARLEIASSQPGAEIYVDDVLVGASPLSSPVVVSAGRRKVTARLEGYLPVTRMVDVAGTDSIPVRLLLVKSEPVPSLAPAPSVTRPLIMPLSTAPTKPAPLPEAPPPRGVPWAGWAVTGVLATGATVTGLLALRASNDLRDKRSSSNVGRDALDDASREAKRWAVATDILGAGALLAGGISLYLTLKGNVDPVSDAGTTVRLDVGPGELGVWGRF